MSNLRPANFRLTKNPEGSAVLFLDESQAAKEEQDDIDSGIIEVRQEREKVIILVVSPASNE